MRRRDPRGGGGSAARHGAAFGHRRPFRWRRVRRVLRRRAQRHRDDQHGGANPARDARAVHDLGPGPPPLDEHRHRARHSPRRHARSPAPRRGHGVVRGEGRRAEPLRDLRRRDSQPAARARRDRGRAAAGGRRPASSACTSSPRSRWTTTRIVAMEALAPLAPSRRGVCCGPDDFLADRRADEPRRAHRRLGAARGRDAGPGLARPRRRSALLRSGSTSRPTSSPSPGSRRGSPRCSPSSSFPRARWASTCARQCSPRWSARPVRTTCSPGLSALGCRIAIDDFGTAYSSLRALGRYHVDTLKIDRALVSGLPDNRTDAALVEHVVSLGRLLDVTVSAEGVETDAQLRALRNVHCSAAAGFLLAPPAAADAATHLLHPGARLTDWRPWGSSGTRSARQRWCGFRMRMCSSTPRCSG